MSPLDPTVEFDSASRRARGITSLSVGTGPTEGLLFALANDSNIHTYNADALTPISSSRFSHESMRMNSFYIKSAISPCGRWIIAGSSDRKAFLYDVSNASRTFDLSPWEGKCSVIEVGGPDRSEVGAVDWGHDIFATCYDRVVRVWRPDVETRRLCEGDAEEQKWNWSWARLLS